MPGNIDFVSETTYWGANLTAYVGNGTIPESRLTDMAERIVAGWYLLDQDKDYPAGAFFASFARSCSFDLLGAPSAVNFNSFNQTDSETNEHVDVQADHYKVVREIGAAATVLLKNVAGALPLRAPKSVAIIGTPPRPGATGSP